MNVGIVEEARATFFGLSRSLACVLFWTLDCLRNGNPGESFRGFGKEERDAILSPTLLGFRNVMAGDIGLVWSFPRERSPSIFVAGSIFCALSTAQNLRVTFFSKSWILLSFLSFFGGEKDFGQKQSLMVTQGSNGKSGSWHEIWRKFQFVSGPKCQNRGKSRTDQSQKRREMKQKTLKMFGSEKSAVNEIFV